MTIHPTDLSPEDQQVLSELAAKSQDEALRQAVNSYLERTAQPSQSNGSLDSEHEREQAFLRAAGAWHDMDTDKLIEEIYEQRLRQTRPEPKW